MDGSTKKLRINCSKFTWRLRCEIMTPVGVRVEPELYCRYAMSGTSAGTVLGPPSMSSRSVSISMILGAISRRDWST
ncbi:Uncharacterised protein [Mycobacteroides abscessus subsp. abscessus]|nr:Uncharacterised protein [Mycobacteroides abscessus subsp. abscessus]